MLLFHAQVERAGIDPMPPSSRLPSMSQTRLGSVFERRTKAAAIVVSVAEFLVNKTSPTST